MSEELRNLEYSQRLSDRSRTVLARSAILTGRCIFEAIMLGGVEAAGRETWRIETRHWADFLAIDTSAIMNFSSRVDVIIDTVIFAGDDRLVQELWSANRHVVTFDQYFENEQITESCRDVLSALRD